MSSRVSGAEEDLFCIVFVIAGGTFFYHNLSKLDLPYTVVMFLYGMMMGVVGLLLPNQYSDLFDGVASIEPKLIFHIFLPVLIFEGSYSMKFHAFRSVLDKVLLLATVGLCINTAILGATVKLMFPKWNWYLVMLVGSILSATDPVAVVALLKDLGVDKRITALVDGEAIMNDGTAIIVFTLFLPAAADGRMVGSWETILLKCLQLTLGAVVWGVFTGGLTQFFLSRTRGNDLVQTCTTVSMAYLTFYIADVWLKASGVLSLCVMGTYLSSNVPSMFPGKEGSMMNNVWHFIVHLANTILFSAVGIIIVRDALPSVKFLDLVYILVLYIAAVIARAAMLVILWPIMNINKDYVIGKSDIILLVHGGLRGGVSTVLALLVAGGNIPRDAQVSILLLTCGIVILTLMVNATTSKLLVNKLGQKRKEMNRIVQMEIGMKHLRGEAKRHLKHAQLRSFFRNVNWAKLSSLLQEISNPYAYTKCIEESDSVMFSSILMRAFKTEVWILKDNGYITENVVRVLTTCCANATKKRRLISTDDIWKYMQYPHYVNKLSYYFPTNATFIGRFVAKKKIDYDQDFFGILLGYSEALKKMEDIFETYIMSADNLIVAQEWLKTERNVIELKIDRFSQSRPYAACAVMTKIAAEIVLQDVRGSAEGLRHTFGFAIPATEGIVSSVISLKSKVSKWPAEMPEVTHEEILSNSDLLHNLSPNAYFSVLQLSKNRNFISQEIIKFGSVDRAAVGIVVSGVVGVLGTSQSEHGSGMVFNITPMLTTEPPSTFIALSNVTNILYITYSDLKSIFPEESLLELRAIKLAAIEVFVPMTKMNLAPFRDWSLEGIRSMVESGRVDVAVSDIYVPNFDIDSGSDGSFEVLVNGGTDNLMSGTEIVCFLSGGDDSGMITKHHPPFIVPTSLKRKLKWNKGTRLYLFFPKLDCDILSDEAKKHIFTQLKARGKLIKSTEASYDESVVSPLNHSFGEEMNIANSRGSFCPTGRSARKGLALFSASNQLMGTTSGPVMGNDIPFSFSPHGIEDLNTLADNLHTFSAALDTATAYMSKYNLEKSLNPIPYLNHLQMLFILEYEQLMVVAIEADQFPYESRDILSNTTAVVIAFLMRFCVESFAMEAQITREIIEHPTIEITNEEERLMNENIAENESFARLVSLWSDRFRHTDDHTCFYSLLIGMSAFIGTHFEKDRRLGDIAVSVFGGLKTTSNRILGHTFASNEKREM